MEAAGEWAPGLRMSINLDWAYITARLRLKNDSLKKLAEIYVSQSRISFYGSEIDKAEVSRLMFFWNKLAVVFIRIEARAMPIVMVRN